MDSEERYDADLRPEEAKALRDLRRHPEPPPELEQRIVASLRARGLIGRSGRRLRFAWMAGVAAAFVIGMALGRAWPLTPTAAEDRPQYVLLLIEGEEYRQPEPQDVSRRVDEYRGWAAALSDRGALVAAEKLEEGRGLLVSADGRVLPATPRWQNELAGYFVIAADSLEAALQVARRSPHLRYGGRIAVIRIEPT